jgi:hypothetical protein
MSLFSRSFAGYRFHGLAISTIVHAAAVCVLLLTSASAWHVFETSAAREARVLYVAAPESEADEAMKTPSTTVSDPVRMTDAMVRDRIQESVDHARQRSHVENLDRLERMGKRLNDVSSQQSIDRMAGVLQRMLGTKPRADQPVEEPIGGVFDFDTAQFHDVRREATANGGWRYVCTLIDAEGGVFEVDMNAARPWPANLTISPTSGEDFGSAADQTNAVKRSAHLFQPFFDDGDFRKLTG